MLRLICQGQHINLLAVENSKSHPISRPREPIATTIPIFADLVAPVAAKRAVRIKTAVCIARFEASSIVAIHMNVPTTAMKESQKSVIHEMIECTRCPHHMNGIMHWKFH
jgi:hypothetical protein